MPVPIAVTFPPAVMVASIVADTCFLFENYYNEDVNPGTGALIGTASADD